VSYTISKPIKWAAACAVAGLCGGGTALGATGDFDLHGFGYQNYYQTTANTYYDADQKGSWDNNFLALIGTFTINDRAKVWAQLETSSDDTTHFTWFFVDYQFTDNLRAHVGRVKLPLGIYNEFIDTKFLQVTSLEPALYRAEANFVEDSYNGVGLDYDQSLGAAGALTWQAYGGNTFIEDPPPDAKDRRAYGGRIIYVTPVDGLRFLLSAYQTQVQLLPSDKMVNEQRWIASADFVSNGWDIKSEYGDHKFQGVDSDAYYVQIARAISEKWTPFAQYNYVTLDKALSSSDSYSQKIWVLGIDYRVRSNIRLRFEDQFNSGYALPVATGEVPVGAGKRNWELFIAGINFVF
jgi:hypothetical protein